MTIKNIFDSKYLWLVLIFIIFLLFRLPGLGFSYHQDEMKWDSIGSLGIEGLGSAPHPPLTGLTFVAAVYLFGPDHLRYLPFLFAIINFWLLFYLLRYKFSRKQILWGLLIFAAGFYSVLASLMVDTDGQILPFFFLLSAISYYKWLDAKLLKNKLGWGIALLFFLIAGLLVKVSFIIVLAAIILDFLIYKNDSLSWSQLVRHAFVSIIILISSLGVIWAASLILPRFNFLKAVAYWRHFIVFSNRNYLQILIQFFKVLFYVSPLLIVSFFFLTRDLVKKMRMFLIFLILGLIFYLILFDFSSGALDRYLQFTIVPFSIVTGVVVGKIFESIGPYNKFRPVFLGCIVGLVLFLTQFLPHFVPALYPKTEWFNRVLTFKWNFVFPFTGGSGPTGFYVSWLFIALIWILTIILIFLILWKNRWHREVLIVILILGFLYNSVFVEEYLFGKINGNSNSLIKNSIDFIKNNKDIVKVITYNNIGGSELSKIGKYERRLFIAPKYETNYAGILKDFNGHYLVIDIPRIDPNSPYSRYFSNCQVVYQEFSHKISSKIYNCQKVQFH